MTVLGSAGSVDGTAAAGAISANESARLDALTAAAILDTPADPRFDGVVSLAATLCGAPIALISFLAADDRQWFKAKFGRIGELAQLDAWPRSRSFCESVLGGDAPVVVPDVREDARFAALDLVTGWPFVRFYAGYPVRSKDGYILGALCVLDTVPRTLDDAQQEGMAALAQQIEALLDLNSRVLRAEATEQRLSHLELLTHAALDVFLFLDEDGAILEANSRAEELYGYTSEELCKLHIRDIRMPEDASTLTNLLREIHRTGGARFETEHRHKDGRVLQVEVAASSLPPLDPRAHARKMNGKTPSIFAVVRDIRDRVEVARVTGTVRAIMQNLQDGVVVTNPSSIIVDWNAGAERILGYRADEVLGKDSAMLFAAPDSAEHRALLTQLFEGHTYKGRIQARDRAGAEVPIDASITVVAGHTGEPALCVSILRDLRAQLAREREREEQRAELEIELERRTQQLFRADRLVTLGTLAGAVGHELNNVAQVMTSSLELLHASAVRHEPPDGEDLASLDTAFEHLRTHARHLLSLARPGPDHAEPQDLRSIVAGALQLLRVAGRARGVTLEASLPEAPIPVLVNRVRVEQVLINLVGNAIDAVHDHAEEDHRRVDVDIRPASERGRVSCTVRDRGCGIARDVLPNIWTPYFTTKGPERGTGLGLAIVRQIVEGYGGTVSVASSGDGTTFTFDLPAA